MAAMWLHLPTYDMISLKEMTLLLSEKVRHCEHLILDLLFRSCRECVLPKGQSDPNPRDALGLVADTRSVGLLEGELEP